MDGGAGLVTGLLGSVTAVATALIQRTANVNVAEFKAKVEARFDEVEAKIKGLATRGDFEALVRRVNQELRGARRGYEALERSSTGSHPTVPSFPELERAIGVDDLKRQVAELERERHADRAAARELQLEVARLTVQLELLLDGRLLIDRTSKG